MKIHLLGHATLFVEAADCRILMDPVLWDPFCEGLNASCPKREIDVERIPEYDVMVISHRHLDHFDLRSLAYLPKHVDVLIPADKLLRNCLKQMGYSQVYPLQDFSKVVFGKTTLLTTRSEVRVPEFGVIVSDPSGVFWNTVDTFFAPPTIRKVLETYPSIDFMLGTWHISMEGDQQYNKPLIFPTELYGQLLSIYDLIHPKTLAPGAQGFKYIGNSAWQNQTVFPTSRERFCYDLAQVLPNTTILEMNPGDIVSLEEGKASHHPQACSFARTVEDDRHLLDFAPVLAGSNWRDPNPEGYDETLMAKAIQQEVEQEWPAFLQAQQKVLLSDMQRWQVIYQLQVQFPSGPQYWWIDFAQETLSIQSGRNPLANFFVFITASTLYSLIHRLRDWDYVTCSGEYRTFNKVYRVHPMGTLKPDSAVLLDPLSLKLSSTHVAENNIYRELEQLLQSPDFLKPTTTEASNDGYMMSLGKSLIKVRKKKVAG
jgi:UDP-MurNAc hydroxylase